MVSTPADPDLSRRGLRLRPTAVAVLAVALLAGVIWLATRREVQLAVGLALVLAVVLDGVAAHLALRRADIEVHTPVDGVAGHDLTYHVRIPGLRRPVRISRPGVWPTFRATPVLVDTDAPGALTLPAPPRGVVRYLVFDLTARGPLGLTESTRRRRVWLPVPLHVGPPAIGHRIDWPAMRSIRFGPTEVAPRGDDLFHGLRPYVAGDAPRTVHWPATAHHGTLMVKEADGTGIVALRVVALLDTPGPAAEVAAGRAAWLAQEALALGWVVQLVTVEADGPLPLPPPLVRPTGPLPVASVAPPRVRTTDRPVRTRLDIVRQLALAGHGTPELERWEGMTRVVAPWGDTWL